MAKKFPKPAGNPHARSSHAPRRVSKIVHDHRGTAVVEWQEAAADQERAALEVQDALSTTRNSKVRGGIEIMEIDTGDACNPYASKPQPPKSPDRKPPRSDLRKLSAWIKMMRELEESKKRGNDNDE